MWPRDSQVGSLTQNLIIRKMASTARHDLCSSQLFVRIDLIVVRSHLELISLNRTNLRPSICGENAHISDNSDRTFVSATSSIFVHLSKSQQSPEVICLRIWMILQCSESPGLSGLFVCMYRADGHGPQARSGIDERACETILIFGYSLQVLQGMQCYFHHYNRQDRRCKCFQRWGRNLAFTLSQPSLCYTMPVRFLCWITIAEPQPDRSLLP